MKRRRLCEYDVSERLFFTAFLLLMGIGYLMALTYLDTSFEGHNGKSGLSVEDTGEPFTP